MNTPVEGLDLSAAVTAALEAVHGQDEGWGTERREAEAAVRAAVPHVLRAAANRAHRQAEAILADMANPHRLAEGDRRHFAAAWLRALAHEAESGALADEIGGVMRQPRLSTVPTVETRTDTIATQEIGGGQ